VYLIIKHDSHLYGDRNYGRKQTSRQKQVSEDLEAVNRQSFLRKLKPLKHKLQETASAAESATQEHEAAKACEADKTCEAMKVKT
jgi:hypothetical protein